MSYSDAMLLLTANQELFQSRPRDGCDLGVEHELFLVKHTGKPTFIIDWPANIKPFYMRATDDNQSLVRVMQI